MATNATAGAIAEPKSTRIARLMCSIIALILAGLVLAAAVVTSFLAVLTMRDGSWISGNAALFGLAIASCALTVLCASLLKRRHTAALAVWVLPAMLLCFVALAFAPFTRGTVKLGYSATATNFPMGIAVALVGVLLLTQVSARLARRNACSCS